jgi:hypothetical protein
MRNYSLSTFLLASAVAINACSKAESSSSAPAGDPAQAPAGGAVSAIATRSQSLAAVDPCSFFTEQQLESSLGLSLEPGQRTANEPSCRFRSSNGGMVSIAIPTGSVSEAEFNSWRQMAGADAEVLDGVGDAAYLWKSRMYVRKGTRTFTVSVDDIPITDAIRKGLTELGKMGSAKL